MEEVENVLFSNKIKKLEFTLDLFKMKINFKKNQNKIVSKFEYSKLRFEELVEQHNYDEYKQNSQQRFNSGILSYGDIKFIKKKNLKSFEIAKYSDGNYTSLSQIEIFKIYDSKQISIELKKILYNSIANKTSSIKSFYSLYYHPGNVLAMIKLYRSNKEFKSAVKSFERFMNLSMFKLKLT